LNCWHWNLADSFSRPRSRARPRTSRIWAPRTPPTGDCGSPLSSPATGRLRLSLAEALRLGHNYIGTEHLLLALIQERDGVAGQVLAAAGADLGRVRAEVVRLLAEYQRRQGPVAGGSQGQGAGRGEGPDAGRGEGPDADRGEDA
jgi:hypothetical protein